MRVRTDWFHVRFLNGVSVWRRHWPSVESSTSQESCWITSSACDWRLSAQCGAPPRSIHLDGGVKDIPSHEASPCSINSHKQELEKERNFFFGELRFKNAPRVPF